MACRRATSLCGFCNVPLQLAIIEVGIVCVLGKLHRLPRRKLERWAALFGCSAAGAFLLHRRQAVQRDALSSCFGRTRPRFVLRQGGDGGCAFHLSCWLFASSADASMPKLFLTVRMSACGTLATQAECCKAAHACFVERVRGPELVLTVSVQTIGVVAGARSKERLAHGGLGQVRCADNICRTMGVLTHVTSRAAPRVPEHAHLCLAELLAEIVPGP
mmetsp:Transcript_46288/g.128816  ORF Transcript_46288/g.128816 Transcript_46288/m.128816 type:complete len:218 (-) Transcript_46288:301-954(-)